MKIVRIIGGLGNQMFQYAFFLSLQNKGFNTKIDISGYANYSLHYGLELEKVFRLELKHCIASDEEIDRIKDNYKYFSLRKILGNILFSNSNRFIKSSHFIQPNFSHFYKNNYTQEDKYLDGYWQNEEYISNYDSLIREIFQWTNIDKKNICLRKKMNQENSISIHIRRLDRPTNFKQLLFATRLRIVWRIASKKYYLNAIKYINNRIEQPQYYILTDNIKWVKRHIPITHNFTIVDWNRGSDSNQDMYLMTKCKHNIISMSSFSWWGAWLNNNPDKIVIAPKKWAPRFISKDEIIPKKWIRL